MSGLYPNAVGATDFTINDSVMRQTNSKEISKQIGRVIDIDQKANRVWVLFPVGPKESLDPSDLIKAIPLMGECLVPKVEASDSERITKLAESIVASRSDLDDDVYRTLKMASNVADNFLEVKIASLCKEIIASKNSGNEADTVKEALLLKHASTYSEDFIDCAIEKIYG